MPIDDDGFSHDGDAPSRSQKRREALEVFQLGEALVELSEAQLDRMPLSDELRAVVLESRLVTQHVARKRQLQFLAKHMRRREDELPAIRSALEHDRGDSRRETAKLHRIEAARDRLLEEGDVALAEFVTEHAQADRNHLRQLIRRAREEHRSNRPPAASRELFRILRELSDSENRL